MFLPATIGKDETAQLTLTIENAGQVQSINTPQLKDFTIVGGPSQETSMQSINGSMTQSSSLIYVIKPNAVGKFVIPSTTANADGKTLQSIVLK
ncbi:MAG: BatD family protein [Ferruginibacter sp.]